MSQYSRKGSAVGSEADLLTLREVVCWSQRWGCRLGNPQPKFDMRLQDMEVGSETRGTGGAQKTVLAESTVERWSGVQ